MTGELDKGRSQNAEPRRGTIKHISQKEEPSVSNDAISEPVVSVINKDPNL